MTDRCAKDHTDYSKRVKSIERFHPERVLGESTGNAMDSRADESLYKPSELGTAACSVSCVKAGENKPFTLTYKAGKREIKKGDTIKFWMPGQGSLGTTPQTVNAEFPGFVTCKLPQNVRAELLCDRFRTLSRTRGENADSDLRESDMIVGPITIGVKIAEGVLREGDCVTFDVGGTSGFIWKKVVGRKEFKVIIEPADDSPKMRLPEPVRIYMEPLEPDHIDVFIDGTVRKGLSGKGSVSVRDKYDNRVSYEGAVAIDDGGRGQTAYISQGRGQFGFTKTNDGELRLRALAPADLNVPDSESNSATEPQSGYNLYFGDMHTHDFNSTAEGYPADCYAWARDEKRLDFQSLAVQVHRWIDNEKWFLMKHMTEYFHEEHQFVTFLAFEWQHSHYGDKVIHYLGIDMPYLPVDDARFDCAEKLYAALKESDAFIISHHVGYELDLHVPGANWDAMDTEIDRLIEIWSMHGSSEGYDVSDRPLIPPFRAGGALEGLKRGLKVGIVAGSDTHTARPGGSCDDVRPYYGGLCAVWAKDLTRRSLFEAFRARRTYALTGARINLLFAVNNAMMGAQIPFSEQNDILVDVHGSDVIAKIEIMKNAEVYRTFTPGKRSEVLHCDDTLSKPAFYHCRITQNDGHLAVSSPVWVGC